MPQDLGKKQIAGYTNKNNYFIELYSVKILLKKSLILE